MHGRHGDKELYKSGYSNDALDRWSRRIQAWSEGSESADARRISARHAAKRKSRDVYCYFDNDVKVCAPFDARQLLRKLKWTDSLPLKPGEVPDEDNPL
ncbi:DUF72 domain-containing protein [Kineobactrum salinum]|uniref:DUF72 domain-containing protein n=1 Tax=Kineobactrum salinum TaxID=2708301 RepID=A0A6C0U6U5_9GAMM|nr:DUF72 domain-containing protein [Kineobactrum salinum]